MKNSISLLIVFYLLVIFSFIKLNDYGFVSCIITMCAYFIVKTLEEKL